MRPVLGLPTFRLPRWKRRSPVVLSAAPRWLVPGVILLAAWLVAGEPVAGQQAQALEPSTQQPAAQPSSETRPPETRPPETIERGVAGATETLRFSFRNAPWEQVLSWFAEHAGLTLDLTDTPPGEFNYVDPREYTVKQAIDVLNGYLLPRGFVTIRRDQFLVVLKTDNPILPNFIPTVPAGALDQYGDHELLRISVRLEGLTPSEVVEQVRSLLGHHGSATALDASESLVIQGFGNGLRDVVALLSDSVVPVTDDSLVFRSFPIKHILASDAERQIRSMFGLGSAEMNQNLARLRWQQQQRQRQRGRDRDRDDENQRTPSLPLIASLAMNMKVSVLNRTNTLLVTATPSAVNLVEEILASIDVPPGDSASSLIDSHEPELRVYVLKDADEADVARTLEVVMPGVVINQDSRQDSIHVLATPREHEEIQSIIDIVDQERTDSEVKVIPLQRSDPTEMAELLESLFDNEDRDERPTIEPELRTNSLAVRATASQMEQIQKTLTAYGETWNGTAVPANSSRIRKLNLPGGNADHVARAVKELLSQDRQFNNPIRIVVPTDTAEDSSGPALEPVEHSDDDSAQLWTKGEVPDLMVDGGDVCREDWDMDADDDISLAQLDSRPASPPTWSQVAHVSRSSPNTRSSDVDGLGDELQRVTIEVRDGELLIYSNDGMALDQVEATIRELVRQMPVRTQWSVFYLRAAEAEATATQLAELLRDDSLLNVGIGYPTSDDPLLASDSRSVRIVPETRTNALFISGPDDKIEAAARFLKILDASDLPPSAMERVPRAIPVHHADATDVAEMIRELYRDYLEDPNARQRDRDRNDNNRRPPAPGVTTPGGRPVGIRLTLAVDVQANELLVSCSDALYRQIQNLVVQRDRAAAELQPVIEVAHPTRMNARDVALILDGLYPQITVTGSAAEASSATTRTRASSSRDSRRWSSQSRGSRSRYGSSGSRRFGDSRRGRDRD